MTIFDGIFPSLSKTLADAGFGAKGVIIRRKNRGYDPLNGAADNQVVKLPCQYFPPEQYQSNLFTSPSTSGDNTAIRMGDLKVSIVATGFVDEHGRPTIPDAATDSFVAADGQQLKIITVDREMSGAAVVNFILQCRA